MVNYIDNSNIIDITTTENEVIISDTGSQVHVVNLSLMEPKHLPQHIQQMP